MNRFEVTSPATHPGKVKDLWTDFTFYCYEPEKVVDHLNKMLEKLKEEREDEKEL